MYTVASPDPDPNRRGGGQLPNPNECNSTLTSGTNNIYGVTAKDRGHRFSSGSPVTNYLAQRPNTTCGHSLVLDTKLILWIRVIRAPHKINSI